MKQHPDLIKWQRYWSFYRLALLCINHMQEESICPRSKGKTTEWEETRFTHYNNAYVGVSTSPVYQHISPVTRHPIKWTTSGKKDWFVIKKGQDKQKGSQKSYVLFSALTLDQSFTSLYQSFLIYEIGINNICSEVVRFNSLMLTSLEVFSTEGKKYYYIAKGYSSCRCIDRKIHMSF